MKKVKKTSPKIYSMTDHKTWERLYARQQKEVNKVACKEYLAGLKKFNLDPKHVPDREVISKRLKKMTGWKLSKAKMQTATIREWMDRMNEGNFPVTDYIRVPEDFDYTQTPDLFHEYFGHLPYFTNKRFAIMARKFGQLSQKASKRQILQISRIWSLGVEFGLVKENGKIKLFGAGLLSSHGELQHTLKMIKKGNVVPFSLREVTATPGRTYQYHNKFYLLDSIWDIDRALDAYAKKEGLAVR